MNGNGTMSKEAEYQHLGRLVEKARLGDLKAYGRVVEQTHALIVAVARHILRDPDEAQDVAQETFLIAYKKLPSLDTTTSVRAWLKRIATNLALNQLKKRRLTFVELEHDLPDPRQLHFESALESEQRALSGALLTLTMEERRLCERFYRGGWSISRLARAEGISDVALKKRLSRLRAHLRKEILMKTELDERGLSQGDLPRKIVELLSAPTLTEVPENPVGAIWAKVKESRPDFTEVSLPEVVSLDDVAQVVGQGRMQHNEYTHHELPDERILRSDTSMPMLVELAKSPKPARVIATGKVYRKDQIDCRHLQAFHQAEILEVGRTVNEWQIAQWLTNLAGELLGDKKLRIEQIDFPFMCQVAFELSIQVDEEWIEVAAFGRFHDDIAEKLGGRGMRAVGAGLGLERWAQLTYGIDDIRKISVAKVPLTG